MAAGILHQLTCLVLLLGGTSGRPSPGSEAEEDPFNLMVNSYNLNTTLHWDYNRKEVVPYFCVEMQNILENEWMVIETCQNISCHFCDVSNKIKDPLTLYKFRVKALVGLNTSISATKEVMLSSVGILGPPYLKVYFEDKSIVVEVFHPKLHPDYDLKEIIDNEDLYYIVYYGNDSKEARDCDESACEATFSISDLEVYCFSAQARSNHFLMTMERSQEICIPVTAESSEQHLAIIIVATVVGFLVILAIFCFIITRWTKARSLMPQSLNSIRRNTSSYAPMSPQQASTCDSVLTFPIEPTVETKPYMDENRKVDTDGSTDSGSKESSDPGYHTSEVIENEEQMIESETDQFNSSSYFHTDSSTNGINSTDTPESEKDEHASEPAPKPPKPNSFGYDKPHFPKEFNV